MSNDFIKRHVITKVEKMVRDKMKILGINNGFLYFDDSIKDSGFKTVFNRINAYNPYIKDSSYPTNWYTLNGSTVITIFDKIKNNDFYTYKKIDGKDHKVRIKRK